MKWLTMLALAYAATLTDLSIYLTAGAYNGLLFNVLGCVPL